MEILRTILSQIRTWFGVVNVRQYGAIGNGTTDDTLAIRAAITAAGVNGTVVFPAGYTFLVSGGLELLAGQTFVMDGATIKRAAQPTVTTTTAGITSGVTTSIPVASVANLRVGMDVVFVDSATTQANLVLGTTLSSVICRITAINGLTLTVNAAPNCTLASGAKCYVSYYMLTLADDCTVIGGTFDGNKSNWTWARWEVTNEIFTGSGTNRATVRECYFHDAPGEGIIINGTYHRILHAHFKNLNGNGVHFSGATHPVVDGCSVDTCNLDVNVAHVMGCVGWSNTIADATVSNCYLANGYAGIGAIDATNDDVTVIGNTIRTCSSYGLYIAGSAANLLIAANRIYSCNAGNNGGGMFVQTATGRGNLITGNLWSGCSVQITSTGGLDFTNNKIETGALKLTACTGSSFTQNKVYGGGITIDTLINCEVKGNRIDRTGDTTNHCLLTASGTSRGIAIRGNLFIGGNTGIAHAQTGYSDLVIADNEFRENYAAGLSHTVSGAVTGVSLMNNYINNGSTSASSWIGLRNDSGGVSIRRNEIENQNGSSKANFGIYIGAGTGSVVSENTVRGTYNISTIKINTGSVNTVVERNYVSAAVSDSGTTSTLTSNTVI